jgi:hypothetical protein
VGEYKSVVLVSWYSWEIPDTLDKLIEAIQSIKASLPKEVRNTKVELDMDFDGCDSNTIFKITCEIPMTEAEILKNEEWKNQNTLAREGRERQEYERLREKFGEEDK